MKTIKINNVEYEVIHEEKDSIIPEDLDGIITEYYDNFAYIVGDYAYGKVRLKGFYEENDKRAKEHNNIKNVEKYIKTNCAYGCKWFSLKRIKLNKE